MAAIILDGNKIAAEIRAEVAAEVKSLAGAGVRPGLAVVLVGLGILAASFTQACAATFQGNETMLWPALGTIAEKVTVALVSVTLLLLGYGLVAVAAVLFGGAAINLLLDKPDLRFKYGQAARSRVEQEFTAEVMARRMLQLYNEVAGLPSARHRVASQARAQRCGARPA